MKKLLVFSSGEKRGGGSGVRALIEKKHEKLLKADIVGVVSNHENGGVRQVADSFGVPFIYFPGPYTAWAYQKIVRDSGADFVALSGWLKLAVGLNPKRTINTPALCRSLAGTGSTVNTYTKRYLPHLCAARLRDQRSQCILLPKPKYTTPKNTTAVRYFSDTPYLY